MFQAGSKLELPWRGHMFERSSCHANTSQCRITRPLSLWAHLLSPCFLGLGLCLEPHRLCPVLIVVHAELCP